MRASRKDEYFKGNVENTKNLCKAVLKLNPALKKFIFISSQAAMGPSISASVKNFTNKENPVSDYGLSKLAAESEIKRMLSEIKFHTNTKQQNIHFIHFKLGIFW